MKLESIKFIIKIEGSINQKNKIIKGANVQIINPGSKIFKKKKNSLFHLL